jgi:hypothetical protein
MRKEFLVSVLFACTFLTSYFLVSQVNPTPLSLPCITVNNANKNFLLPGLVYNDNCINVGDGGTTTNIFMGGNNAATLKAGKEIVIKPSSNLRPVGNGQIHAFIEKENIDVVWYPSPNAMSPGYVGKYYKMETGFRIPSFVNNLVGDFLENNAIGLNPFDPEDIDFKILLKAPNGEQLVRYAFYYKPFVEQLSGSYEAGNLQNQFVQDTTSFPWRFRFAPDQIGLWSAKIEVKVKGHGTFYFPGFHFQCMSSDHKGYLSISTNAAESDRWMYYGETGEPFYAIALNLGISGPESYLPSESLRHLNGLQKLVDVGGNFTRFELGAQSALPDWPNYKNYSSKLDEMYAFDRMVAKSELDHVYFILFRHHVEVNTGNPWDNIRWEHNPYKNAFGIEIDEYFTNPDVLKAQKNTLRYIYSRWGYSTNMAAYSYSEVDNWYSRLIEEIVNGNIVITPPNQNFSYNAEMLAGYHLRSWILNQHSFIRNQLNNKAKFTHTYASVEIMETYNTTSFFNISDFLGLHVYSYEKNSNFLHRFDDLNKYWDQYQKPIIIEEQGVLKPILYCCSNTIFHNDTWATAMMGGFGTGMDWWWNRGIMENGYQKDLFLVKIFFEGENLRGGKYSPQKWADKSNFEKRKIENFVLVSKNKDRALGWVHNATYYWRNLATDNGGCIQNLVDNSPFSNPPCFFDIDPFGFPYVNNDQGYDAPQPWNHVYANDHESSAGLDNSDYDDDFTNEGGWVLVGANFEEEILIKKLKVSGVGSKKHWYRIDYYVTRLEDQIPIHSGTNGTQTIHTNILGRLRPKIPVMGNTNPDFAYKVTYLGHYKNYSENTKDSSDVVIMDRTLKNKIDLLIIPNPNNGTFRIECENIFIGIKFCDQMGQVVFERNDLLTKKIEISTRLSSGIYILSLFLENGTILQTKVSIL